MAKLSDIEEESIFSPVHKDPERRAISLGLIISLPSLLGMVTGRGNFIKGGMWQSLSEEIISTYSKVVDEAARNPATQASSGSVAKNVLMDKVNTLINRQNPHALITPNTLQQTNNIELIKNIMNSQSEAFSHFKISKHSVYVDYGPGGGYPFGKWKKMTSKREVLRQDAIGAFNEWWGNEGKSRVQGIVGDGRNTGSKVTSIRHDLVSSLNPKRGLQRIEPWEVFKISYQGVELGELTINSDKVSNAFKSYNSIKDRMNNFYTKHGHTPSKIHERIIEIALERTKASALSSPGGIGPWDTPLTFTDINDPKFKSHLENDPIFRERFYKEIEKQYASNTGQAFKLTGNLQQQGSPWKLAPIFTKEGALNVAHLDHLTENNNFDFSNSNVTELEAKLKSSRTGLSGIQADALVTGGKGRYDALHKQIYNPVGDNASEIIFGEKRKAVELIKVRDAFRQEINKIKSNVSALVNAAKGNDTASKLAAKELEALAKQANMTSDSFKHFINHMEVKAEISADMYGGSSFKKANIILTRKGFTDVKLTVPLTDKGAFIPNAGAKIHSSPLFMSNLAPNTVTSLKTIDIAMLGDMVKNSGKYINDFVQSGYMPDKMYNFHKAVWGEYMDKAHTQVTGMTQNQVRRSKLVVEELGILKGEASPRWYRKFAAGYEALESISNIAKTHSTILALDFEFNSKNTLGFESTMGMVHNEHTRPYSASFIKSRGGRNEIINHWIRPDNWLDIRDNVKGFMLEQNQKGSISGEAFGRIDALMHGANEYGKYNDGKFETEFYLGQDKEGKWKHHSLEEFKAKRIPKYAKGIEKVVVHEEIGSSIEIAKSIFNTVDGGTHFLTHGGEEADLVLWNKRVTNQLEQIKSGVIRHVDPKDIKLLERLAKETSAERLISRGSSLDTHSMAMVVLGEHKASTPFGLTDIYSKLISMDVGSQIANKDELSKAMMDLGNLLPSHGNTKLTSDMKRLINLFPNSLKDYLTRWIAQNPQDAKGLLSEGLTGHHVSSFDSSITAMNQLLLSAEWERTRRENPGMYLRKARQMEVAKLMNQGRQLSHFHNMDLVKNNPLFQGDDYFKGQDELRASLFSGSPSRAAKATGYLLRLENMLPFGTITDLSKQKYQVFTQRMLPALEYDAAASSGSQHILTAKPILGDRLFTTSQQSGIEEMASREASARFGKEGSVRTTRPLNILYLPGTNSIVGEDSALFTNKKAMINNMNFFRDPIEKLKLNLGVTSNSLLLKESMKGRTIIDFMEATGLSERVIESVRKSGNGDMPLAEFMRDYSGKQGSGGAVLELFSHDQIVADAIDNHNKVVGYEPKTSTMGPKDSFFATTKGVNLESGGKVYTRVQRESVVSGIKREVIIKGLTYDTSKNMFIFDLTGVRNPSVGKWVTQLKKMKSMQIGYAANTFVGKGVDLIAGMKKLDAAQLIDVQIRRVLADIYKDKNIKTFTQQQTKIRNVLMKAFNLNQNEVSQVFRINRSPVHHSQIGLYGKEAMATVELIDHSLAKVESSKVMGNILAMLEEQGLTANKLKKVFREQYTDVIHENYSSTKKLDKVFIGKQLDKLYDGIYEQQKKGLDKWIADQGTFNLSSEVGAAKQRSSHAMRTIMKKGLAFYDLHILPNRSAMIDRIREGVDNGLTLEAILKEDFATMASGERIDNIYAAHSSFMILDEAAMMEDLGDVSKYKGVLKDHYGTPTKGSSTIWETLIRTEAMQGEALARNKFLPELIASFGWFNSNIRGSLETHGKALESLRLGYDLEGAKIFKDNIYSVSYMAKKGAKKYVFESDFLAVQGKLWGTVKLSSSSIEDALVQIHSTSMKMNTPDSDTFIKNLIKKEFGEGYLESSEYLNNKKEIIDDIRTRLVDGETKNSITQLDKLHIFDYKKVIGKQQFLSYQIPDLAEMLESKLVSTTAKEKELVRGFVQAKGHGVSDKSLFFKHFREALKTSADNLSEEEMLKKISWLKGQEGRMHEIVFPHLEHDGPMLDGKQYKIYGESAAKLNSGRFIEEYGKKVEEVAEKLAKDIGSISEKGLTPAQEAQIASSIEGLDTTRSHFFKNIAGQYTRTMGLAEASWKSQRAYAPIMYGKAVDVSILLNQGLGAMLADVKEGKGKIRLSHKIFHPDNAVLKALQSDKVRKALVESGETIFTKALDSTNADSLLKSNINSIGGKNATNATYADLFHNILGLEGELPNSKNVLKNGLSLFREKGGHAFYSAKGMGIGEGIMSHSMFAELLKGGNPGALAALEGIEANPDRFREVMTGKRGVREMFARSPLFENFFGARLRNVYLMPDEMFERMGVSPADSKRMIAVSAFDMLLHGGDFDGDLSNFMLTKSSMYTKEYIGQSSNWKHTLTDAERVKQWINLRIQQEGKAGLTIGGRNYLGIEEIDDRLLIRTEDGRSMKIQEDVASFFKFLENPVQKGSIADKQRSYMLQQALTPIFGQKAKMTHHLYLGENPAMKTEIVDELSKMLSGPVRAGETSERMAQTLFDVGEITNDQRVALLKGGKYGKLKELAKKHQQKITSAWDHMQQASDIPLWEHNINSDGTLQMTEGKMKRTRFGVFDDWLRRRLIHGVPIEKAKSGTLNEFYNMTAQFQNLTSGRATEAQARDAIKYFWNETPMQDARLENFFVGTNVDNGLNKAQVLEIRQAAEKEMTKTLRSYMILQKAGAVMHKSGSSDKPWGAAFTDSKTAKNAIFGAQVDLMSQDKGFIHSSLTNMLLSAEQKSMATDAYSANVFMMDSLEAEFSKKRTVVESATTWVKEMLDQGGRKGINKWGKRALIGGAIMAVFDPNTNSMLLPDLEVNGEKYDIPSFDEISKSYKNRFGTMVRGKSAPFLDKMAKQLDLPFSIGSRSVQRRGLPPNPNRVVYNTRERRNNILDIKEYARQLNGIMLGQ